MYARPCVVNSDASPSELRPVSIPGKVVYLQRQLKHPNGDYTTRHRDCTGLIHGRLRLYRLENVSINPGGECFAFRYLGEGERVRRVSQLQPRRVYCIDRSTRNQNRVSQLFVQGQCQGRRGRARSRLLRLLVSSQLLLVSRSFAVHFTDASRVVSLQ